MHCDIFDRILEEKLFKNLKFLSFGTLDLFENFKQKQLGT
jgi:hypothetical protein